MGTRFLKKGLAAAAALVFVAVLGARVRVLFASPSAGEPQADVQSHVAQANKVVMVQGERGWIGGFDRVWLEPSQGITWVRVSTNSGSFGQMPEKWMDLVFDGPPALGREIIIPKRPPPCEGCGWILGHAVVVYAWGEEGSTLRFRTAKIPGYPGDRGSPAAVEGNWIEDPRPPDAPPSQGYPYQADSIVTLNPPVVQAGRATTVTMTIPVRMRPHIDRVEFHFPEPVAPSPTNKIDNFRTVVVPYTPSGVYRTVWAVPMEYYSQDNLFGGSTASIKVDTYSNKGSRPLIDYRYVSLQVPLFLRIAVGIQGKGVAPGERGEWDFRNPQTNPLEAWMIAEGGHVGSGRYRFRWQINGRDFETEPGNFPALMLTPDVARQSRFRDQNVLREATSITATVTDAIGNSATATFFVGPPQIAQKQTKEMWIEPVDSTVNREQSLPLRAWAVLADGRKLEITGEVDFAPANAVSGRTFRSPASGTFTVTGTTKTFEGAIRPATVTVRPKKRIELRIEPSGPPLYLVTGRQVVLDIVEVYEDGSRQKVADKAYSSSEPGTFLVSGDYQGMPTRNAIMVIVRTVDRMWLEPKTITVNKNETVRFTAKARFTDGTEEDFSARAAFSPARDFKSDRGGKYQVTASASDLPGAVEPAVVTVREKNRTALYISPFNVTVLVNEKTTLRVVETYDDRTEKVVATEEFVSAVPGTFTRTGRFGGETTENQATITVTAAKTPDVKPAEVKPAETKPPVKTTPPPVKATPVPGKVDDALQDILRDTNAQEECQKADARALFGEVNGLVGRARSQYSLFMAYSNKFMKEIGDRASDICQNGIAAYCFKSAVAIGKTLDTVVPQILDLRNRIIRLHGTCPPFAEAMKSQGQTVNGLISTTSGLGAYDDRLEEMRRRLNEAGCDENELIQLADRIPPPPGLDPSLLQSGGIMQEIPGDAVDNDADGFQDESLEGLAGFNVTFVLYDSGSAKDDTFSLTISKFGNLGETPNGGQRSYGLNLPPGSYVATVRVIIAPDDVGTFTLSIFENGEKIASLSGGPSQGSSASLPFTVKGAK